MPAGAKALSLLVFAILIPACSRTPAAQAAGSRPARPAPATPPEFGPGRARVEVRSQAVSLLLPDSQAWSGRTESTWSVLRHDATRSQLYVKQWRAARLVSAQECLNEARLGQPALVAPRDEEVVERRQVTAPPGFDGEIVVVVREQGGELHGHADLVSAGVARCYVAAFHTVAVGTQREQVIGRRLAVIVSDTLERVRTRSVDERAKR